MLDIMAKKLVILLFFVITIPILCVLFANNVLGSSPSFGHQEIRDERHDVIDMCLSNSEASMMCKNSETTQQRNQSNDVISVDYFSDGKTLNSTLWLQSKIENVSLSYLDIPSFGVFIDADSNTETGWVGIDYQLEMVWNNGTWNNTLYQFSVDGGLEGTRILKEKTKQQISLK